MLIAVVVFIVAAIFQLTPSMRLRGALARFAEELGDHGWAGDDRTAPTTAALCPRPLPGPGAALPLTVKLDAEETATIITRFIRDHVEDAGAAGVVLGLSGGLDSALVATLATRALGPDRVAPFFLPAAGSNDEDRRDALSVAKHLGLELEERSIAPIVDAVQKVMQSDEKETLGNAAARARMILLYAEARKRRALVLGTGNKSELLVGYFTKHGDGGTDLLPIGDLYKTQVRLLAAHLDVPQAIIDKTPSAGLWPDQSDEAELGVTYDVLDAVLLGMEAGLDAARIAQDAGTDRATVARIDTMRRNSEHKRNAPRVPKLGIRSLTSDWRRAVTEGGESR